MLNQLSIRTKITLVLALTMIPFTMALWQALQGLEQTGHRFEQFLSRDQTLAELAHTMHSDRIAMEHGLAVVVLNSDTHFGQSTVYDAAKAAIASNGKQFQKLLQQARQLSLGDAAKLAQLDKIEQQTTEQDGKQTMVLLLATPGSQAGYAFLPTEQSSWRKLEPELTAFTDQLQKSVESNKRDTLAAVASAFKLALFYGCLAALIGIAASIWVVRNISGRVRRAVLAIDDLYAGEGDLTRRLPADGADEISHMAQSLNGFIAEISSMVASIRSAAQDTETSTRNIAHGVVAIVEQTDQQKGQLTETTRAMAHISDLITQVGDNTVAATAATARSDVVIQQGRETGQATLEAMQRIDGSMRQTIAAVNELNLSLKQISKISTTIKAIADQTNLLALNASIEAARAGEQGRGFAVVADEVRKLAERTAGSTVDISKTVAVVQDRTRAAVVMLERAQQEVETGVSCGRENGEQLAEIETAGLAVKQLMHNIDQATQEQSQLIGEVLRNLGQIAGLADDSVVGAYAVRDALTGLQMAERSLESLVGQFRIDA